MHYMARKEITRYYNHKCDFSKSKTYAKLQLKHIPSGKLTQYKPFWTKQLQVLKIERDEARKRAEKHKTPENMIKWNQKTAKLKKKSTL